MEFVDLGLRSRTMWATCNIGATKPEEPGTYFAWGETDGCTFEELRAGKRKYDGTDYSYGVDEKYSKYTKKDKLKILENCDDAAFVNCGEEWVMPEKKQFMEILHLPHTWDETRKGWVFTGENGNTLFFPSGGRLAEGYLEDSDTTGNYWSRTVEPDHPVKAWAFEFDDEGFADIDFDDRFWAHNIRPVKNKEFGKKKKKK